MHKFQFQCSPIVSLAVVQAYYLHFLFFFCFSCLSLLTNNMRIDVPYMFLTVIKWLVGAECRRGQLLKFGAEDLVYIGEIPCITMVCKQKCQLYIVHYFYYMHNATLEQCVKQLHINSFYTVLLLAIANIDSDTYVQPQLYPSSLEGSAVFSKNYMRLATASRCTTEGSYCTARKTHGVQFQRPGDGEV